MGPAWTAPYAQIFFALARGAAFTSPSATCNLEDLLPVYRICVYALEQT
jgi:hypothetical protein